jgi:hypothetical protein
MNKAKKKMLLAASVAGILAVTGFAANSGTLYAADGVACSGINACKGQGWINSPSAEECTAQGGKVVDAAAAMDGSAPAPAAAAAAAH